MRIVGPAFLIVLVAACEPAPIGSYPETDDIRLPNRKPEADDEGATSEEEGVDPPSAASSFTLTVTLGGTGTGNVTSTPGGVTCAGQTCSGTFPKGTQVTLVAAPAAGSVFTGWAGACTGTASCAPVLDADVEVTANLESIAGTYAGTYTHSQQNNGCTFNNAGNLSITIAADGSAFSTTGTIDGLELRQLSGCTLVRKSTGTAPKAPATIDGNKASGTLTFTVQGASGPLPLPYTGTISGNKLSGSWTCPTCVGSFTLTKQ